MTEPTVLQDGGDRYRRRSRARAGGFGCDGPWIGGHRHQFLKPGHLGDIAEAQPQLVRRTRSLFFLRADFEVRCEAIYTAASIWEVMSPA